MESIKLPDMHTQKILVDFDVTLFKTHEWMHDLWTEFAARTGLSYADVGADGQRFHVDPVLGGYDFNAHCDSYGLDRTLMWRRVEEMARSKDYLYDDSPAFIQQLQDAGYRPAILSFGERDFQTVKILPTLGRLSGIKDREAASGSELPFTVVMEKKGDYIAREYAGEQGVLVDDVPDQNLPGGFSEIHIDRHSDQQKHEDKVRGFVVANLAQALDVIRSLYG